MASWKSQPGSQTETFQDEVGAVIGQVEKVDGDQYSWRVSVHFNGLKSVIPASGSLAYAKQAVEEIARDFGYRDNSVG